MVQNAISDKNERADAANTYYFPRSDRKNLAVVTEVQVRRVLLSETADAAGDFGVTGMEMLYDGRVVTARARKETILSTGTFISPKILELSGIGNAATLKSAGVEPKVNLPGVGENFHDHWAFGYSYRILPTVNTLDQLRDPVAAKAHTEQYLATRTGALAAGQSAVAYLPASHFFNVVEIAEIKLGLEDDVQQATDGLREQYSIMRKWFSDENVPFIEIFPQYQYLGGLPTPPSPDEKFVTFFTFLTHPFSRGSVHITSADPSADTLLDPRFWSHPLDKKLSDAAYRFGRDKLTKTEPFASLLTGKGYPADGATDEEIEAMLCGGFSGHGIGTCAMLPRDKAGVVNDEYKVYGTKGLRVVDASVFPMHLSNHPQAMVYALARRTTRLLRKQHGLKG